MFPIIFDERDISTGVTTDEPDRWEPAGYYSPGFEQHINEELDRLAALGPNWDREGAPAIDRGIIEAARAFVARLPKNCATIPSVVPSAAGTLQFEWNTDSRSLELEIETPSRIHYLKWHPEEGIEDEDLFDIHDTEQAVFLIRWFMRGVANV